MTTVAAYPVSPGNCPHCGHHQGAWTAPEIVAAIQTWEGANGRPPRAFEWERATPDSPHNSTVLRVFGTWNRALSAAGFKTRDPGAGRMWSREQIVEAFHLWVEEHGRFPSFIEWRAGPFNPSASTATKMFGTWNAARRAAGYRGADKQHASTMARRAVLRPRDTVEAAPVSDAVRSYLGKSGAVGPLAEIVGVDPARLLMLLRGERERIEVGAADMILTAIDRPDVLAGLVAA